MRRHFKRSVVALLTVAMASVVCVPSAEAYYWPGTKWSGSTQIVSSYADVTGNYLTALNQSINNFNTATELHLSRHNGSQWVAKSQDFGNVEWEGQTETDAKNGKTVITWAITKVNTRHIPASTSVARIKLLWLHELSHGWGLGHNESNARVVMYPVVATAYANGVRTLTQDDINGLNRIY